MTRRGVSAALLALGFALGAAPVWAGNLYNSFGAQSPKIIQSDDTVASEWDEAAGAKKVTQATKTAGEDVDADVMKTETRGAAVNILTATTTTVKTGAGHLNHLIAVGGTMGNVTIYDNTAASGTVLFGPATPTAGGVIVADIEFAVGLTVVTAAATAISGSVR